MAAFLAFLAAFFASHLMYCGWAIIALIWAGSCTVILEKSHESGLSPKTICGRNPVCSWWLRRYFFWVFDAQRGGDCRKGSEDKEFHCSVIDNEIEIIKKETISWGNLCLIYTPRILGSHTTDGSMFFRVHCLQQGPSDQLYLRLRHLLTGQNNRMWCMGSQIMVQLIYTLQEDKSNQNDFDIEALAFCIY